MNRIRQIWPVLALPSSSGRRNSVDAHIWTQRFGNEDRPIRLFGEGGGAKLAEAYTLALLGAIPTWGHSQDWGYAPQIVKWAVRSDKRANLCIDGVQPRSVNCRGLRLIKDGLLIIALESRF